MDRAAAAAAAIELNERERDISDITDLRESLWEDPPLVIFVIFAVIRQFRAAFVGTVSSGSSCDIVFQKRL